MPPEPRRTRLAPSPTGALHLGNARTFLVNWALARSHGWGIVFRVEDLDGPRVKPDAAAGIARTLAWLGIDWDGDAFVQSDDLRPYRDAVRSLAAAGLAYPCSLSRSQIEAAASAPQEGAHEVRYPAHLRPPLHPRDFDAQESDTAGWRFATPPSPVRFTDAFAGPQAIDPAQTIGDFIIWTRRRQPAYQLAVVVDDHRQGITDVVRGDDLLDSAARQILLYRALGIEGSVPTYTHLPLIVGADGRRLAKRHGDTRVDTYAAIGVPPEAIVGLVAWWSTAPAARPPRPSPMSAGEFRSNFNLSTMPREQVRFTQEDDRWLRSQAR